jgi:mRNA interferase MazF
MKNFDKWNTLKQKLDISDHKAPYVKAGDIWWISIGENIGSEVDGKSILFSRPVIIIKKLSHNFYHVIPTTTKSKEGSWYIKFRQNEIIMHACLHQSKSIDYKRLSTKIGELDEQDFNKIKNAFLHLLS